MGKKKKKKIYQTPKKIKHVHIKNPLNILSSILNPKCENCQNSMAVHYNRYTCSYCSESFKKIEF